MRIGDVDVLVETTAIAGTEPASAADAAREKMADSFERAKDTIVAVAKSTVDMITRLPRTAMARPATVEVEFALGFTASGSVLLAGAGATANLTVRLAYDTAVGDDSSNPLPTPRPPQDQGELDTEEGVTSGAPVSGEGQG